MKRRQPSSRVRVDPDRVRKLSNRLNINQNELARVGGTSTGHMSQLMSETRCPPATPCKRLMEAPGIVRFEELLILEIVS